MEDIVRCLKCFIKDKRKVYLLCGCDSNIINSISRLLYIFLKGKLKIRNKNKVKKRLFHIRYFIRQLADNKVRLRRKRKILIDKEIRKIIFPFLKDILIPKLFKSLKQKKSDGKN